MTRTIESLLDRHTWLIYPLGLVLLGGVLGSEAGHRRSTPGSELALSPTGLDLWLGVWRIGLMVLGGATALGFLLGLIGGSSFRGRLANGLMVAAVFSGAMVLVGTFCLPLALLSIWAGERGGGLAGAASIALVLVTGATCLIGTVRYTPVGRWLVRAKTEPEAGTVMPKKTLSDLGDLKGKKVLVRVDFNVPLDKKTGAVKNDRRIRAALPTIRHLLDAGAAVIAMSHLGRPEKATADERKNLTMDAVAAKFSELLKVPVKKAANEVVGPAVSAAASALKPGEVLLLENLRFDPREQKNDPAFAAAIAGLGDAYVNDAFGTCHNDKDASMVAVPAALKAAGKPRAVGLLVARELEVIEGLMGNPKKPVLGIMGGAKVSDKLAFIAALLLKVDHLLVGGKMTYTFLKAQGVDVGATKVDDAELTAVKLLLAHVGTKITLPVDYVAARSDDLLQTQVCEGPIPAGFEGVDIGPKTIELFKLKIAEAATIIWNGPLGWFEQAAFARGTQFIAEAMSASAGVTVVGGGETAEAVEQFGYADKMTHISTGGGAFLAYVEGKTFKSLEQIDNK